MKETATQRKMNEQAREALASVLLFDIADSRLREVTVTGCKVSPDRRNCTVFFEAPAGTYDEYLAAMKKASGAIRGALTKRLDWRVTPQLTFVLDETIDDALRISAAISKEAAALSEMTGDGDVRVDESAYIDDEDE